MIAPIRTSLTIAIASLLVSSSVMAQTANPQPQPQAAADNGVTASFGDCYVQGGSCDANVMASACDSACGSILGGGCGTGCNTGCCGGLLGNNGLLGLGIIKRSEHEFDGFISPMTNPIFFEDPRQLTEAHFFWIDHKLPQAAGSGNVRVMAVQLRARLSENVSLIATKDGYVTSSNPIVNNGWADLAAGLKFSLLRNVQRQRLLSAGFTFELPTGEADPFQGNGDGELNLFLSGGARLGCRAHWVSAGGFRVPMNSSDESTSSYWSNHLDYRVLNRFYLFTEGTWYHWLKSGQDGPIAGIEGLDLINFGNPAVAGNDIVTAAVGAKFKPNCHNEFGLAWEFPVTDRRDILDNRLMVNWNLRY